MRTFVLHERSRRNGVALGRNHGLCGGFSAPIVAHVLYFVLQEFGNESVASKPYNFKSETIQSIQNSANAAPTIKNLESAALPCLAVFILTQLYYVTACIIVVQTVNWNDLNQW